MPDLVQLTTARDQMVRSLRAFSEGSSQDASAKTRAIALANDLASIPTPSNNVQGQALAQRMVSIAEANSRAIPPLRPSEVGGTNIALAREYLSLGAAPSPVPSPAPAPAQPDPPKDVEKPKTPGEVETYTDTSEADAAVAKAYSDIRTEVDAAVKSLSPEQLQRVDSALTFKNAPQREYQKYQALISSLPENQRTPTMKAYQEIYRKWMETQQKKTQETGLALPTVDKGKEAPPQPAPAPKPAPTTPPKSKNDCPPPATEKWGVRFTFNQYANEGVPCVGSKAAPPQKREWYLSLLPAMQSTMPRQGGRDVPGAMPGMLFRSANRIVRHQIPGMAPVIQNLGVESLVITLVGCFTGDGGLKGGWNGTGASSSSPMAGRTTSGLDARDNGVLPPSANDSSSYLGEGHLFLKDGCFGQCPPPGGTNWTSDIIDDWKGVGYTVSGKSRLGDIAKELDAYEEYTSFYRMGHTLAKEMEVEINVRRNYDGMKPKKNPLAPYTSPLRDEGGNPKVKAYVRRCDAYLQFNDRVWYLIELEVSDHGIPTSNKPLKLTNVVGSASSASPSGGAQSPKKDGAPASSAKKNPLTDKEKKDIIDTARNLRDKYKALINGCAGLDFLCETSDIKMAEEGIAKLDAALASENITRVLEAIQSKAATDIGKLESTDRFNTYADKLKDAPSSSSSAASSSPSSTPPAASKAGEPSAPSSNRADVLAAADTLRKKLAADVTNCTLSTCAPADVLLQQTVIGQMTRLMESGKDSDISELAKLVQDNAPSDSDTYAAVTKYLSDKEKTPSVPEPAKPAPAAPAPQASPAASPPDGRISWEDTPRDKKGYITELPPGDTDYLRSYYKSPENIDALIDTYKPARYQFSLQVDSRVDALILAGSAVSDAADLRQAAEAYVARLNAARPSNPNITINDVMATIHKEDMTNSPDIRFYDGGKSMDELRVFFTPP